MPTCPYNRRVVIDGNTDADVQANIADYSGRAFIERLVWGIQQGIFLGEFDGPRRTRALVKARGGVIFPLIV